VEHLNNFHHAVEVMLLQAGLNTALVIVGTTFLGIAAGVIGTFALLRKRSLMADALAHSALPGLGLAFLLGTALGIGGKHLWLLLAGATISGVVGVCTVQAISRLSRLKEDCAIGAVLSVFFGAGVVLLSIIQSLGTGEEGGLHHFIYGQTAAMTRGDALTMLVCAAATIAVSILAMKEFRLVCFDRDFAAATGWPVSSIDLGMMALVTLVTVIGLQAVGILLIVALLVIPPAAARFWTNRTTIMVPLAGVIGGLSGYFGSVASALLPGIPVGSVIVLVASSFFLVSMIIAPARGLLGTATTQLWMRVRIAEDHLLRSLYEQAEPFSDKGTVPPPVSIDNLTFTKQWHNSTRLLLLYWCHYRGWIDIAKKSGKFCIELTSRGTEHASRLVRNHRLWEEYIATYADVSLSHVDYSADLVEHSLSPAIIALLEESLAARKGPEWLLRKQRSLHPILEELG